MFHMLYDPDGYAAIALPANRDLGKEGFGIVETGVRDLVQVLWEFGIRVVCSCHGHLEEMEPYPWVTIRIDLPDSSQDLSKLFRGIARFNKSRGELGHLPQVIKTWLLVPADLPVGLVVYLQPCDINPERSGESLSQLRADSQALAAFLKEYCQDIFC